MTRPSYARAVRWIAYHDNEGDGDSIATIASYVTVCMVADLWDVDYEDVASDVARERQTNGLPVGES